MQVRLQLSLLELIFVPNFELDVVALAVVLLGLHGVVYGLLRLLWLLWLLWQDLDALEHVLGEALEGLIESWGMQNLWWWRLLLGLQLDELFGRLGHVEGLLVFGMSSWCGLVIVAWGHVVSVWW